MGFLASLLTVSPWAPGLLRQTSVNVYCTGLIWGSDKSVCRHRAQCWAYRKRPARARALSSRDGVAASTEVSGVRSKSNSRRLLFSWRSLSSWVSFMQVKRSQSGQSCSKLPREVNTVPIPVRGLNQTNPPFIFRWGKEVAISGGLRTGLCTLTSKIPSRSPYRLLKFFQNVRESRFPFDSNIQNREIWAHILRKGKYEKALFTILSFSPSHPPPE